MKRATLFLWLCLAACSRPKTVAVRVLLPGLDTADAPVAGTGVVALPYDRDSVLAGLRARAKTPRPDTTALDSLYAAFRGPFSTFSRSAYVLEALKDSAAKAAAGSPEATRLAARVREAEAARAAAARTLDAARREFDARVPALRKAVRAWEDTTYAGYAALVKPLMRMELPVSDTTGPTGWATLTLGTGHWWLYVRAFDSDDPNAEWYWNLPITAGDTVVLSRANARHQAKY